MDRISELPDELLCQILSFSPIHEAASTSVLSKRWRNLFAFMPNLCILFHEYHYWDAEHNYGSFIDFVDRILAVSDNSTVRKLSLVIRHSVGYQPPHINRWCVNIMSRGILDFELDLATRDINLSLPLEVFTCKTLVKLKLGSEIRIAMVPENASLPALKSLFLRYVKFDGSAFETLLSACHVLEELNLLGLNWDWKQCQTVSAPTLERLTVSCRVFKPFNVSFDTPRLSYLNYRDYVADEYPIVNFNSLVEAEIFLSPSLRKGNLKNLIKGLRNVEILNLSSLQTSKIFYSYAEEIPLFKNLTRLTIATAAGMCWKLVPLLLTKSPNLETLLIRGPMHFSNEYDYGGEFQSLSCECLSQYYFLSSGHVKVVETTGNGETIGELEYRRVGAK